MKIVLILVLLMIPIITEGKDQKKESMVFNDGNGNNYMINSTELEYQPVPMEMTNTGKFDNGDPKKVSITKEDYSKIEKLFNIALSDKKNHSNVRPKGSYFLKKIKGKKTKSATLEMDSESGEQILNLPRLYSQGRISKEAEFFERVRNFRQDLHIKR